MQNGDEDLPSIILASRGTPVKMLITHGPHDIVGSGVGVGWGEVGWWSGIH